MECLVIDCENKAKTKGYCCKHYHRLVRYGSPTGEPVKREIVASICYARDCTKQAKVLGLCRVHYDHKVRLGDENSGKFYESKGNSKKWLINLVEESNTNDCVPYPFKSKSPNGYGFFADNKTKFSAHVFVCELVNGSKPDTNSIVRHLCGNGHLSCVNPKHLAWGSPEENWNDSLTHKTAVYGEKHVLTSLTNEIVKEIYDRVWNGERNVDLALEFGVTRSKISSIKYGKIWSFVTRGIKNEP